FPIPATPVEVFPANHVAVNGPKLVEQRNRVVVVDKDKVIAYWQILEKVYQQLVPFNRHEYPYVQYAGCILFACYFHDLNCLKSYLAYEVGQLVRDATATSPHLPLPEDFVHEFPGPLVWIVNRTRVGG